MDHELCADYIGGDAALWREIDRLAAPHMEDAKITPLIAALSRAINVERDAKRASAICYEMANVLMPEGEPCAYALPTAALCEHLPRSIAFMRALGADDELIRLTLSDVYAWLADYQKLHGTPGISELCWVTNHFCGNIFQFGALQLQFVTEPYPYYIFSDGDGYIAIAEGGQEIASDGQPCGVNGRADEVCFVTATTRRGNILSGYRVDGERGVVTQEVISVDTVRHPPVFYPCRPSLMLHIPLIGNISAASVRHTLEVGLPFFKKLGVSGDAVITATWMLDPQFKKYLSEKSNTLAFADRFFRFPLYHDESWVGRYIFNSDFKWSELPEAPRDTSLQRAVHDIVERGGMVYDTGGIMFI